MTINIKERNPLAVSKGDGLVPQGVPLSEASWSLCSRKMVVGGNSRRMGGDSPPSPTHWGSSEPKSDGSGSDLSLDQVTLRTTSFRGLGKANSGDSLDGHINGVLRFILTNTGSLTTPQLYSALRNSLRHHPETLSGIIKVKPVLQPNRQQRFDLWVKREVAAGLQHSLKLNYQGRQTLSNLIATSNLTSNQAATRFMLPRYRLCRWKSYRDRPIKRTPTPAHTTQPTDRSFLTWNINGIKSKLPALQSLLADHNIAVAAVQEHKRAINQYIPGIQGYKIFERPKEPGFMGHCLYVNHTYVAHEVPTACKNIIHVKINGLADAEPWHVLAVYMPSGNSRVKDRREVWDHICTTLEPLQSRGISRKVTILGDLNEDINTVTSRLRMATLKSLNLALCTDPEAVSTRHLSNKEGRYIDHFINSDEARTLTEYVKVAKDTFSISDHWPVLMRLKHSNITGPALTPMKSWNRKQLNGHSINLALSHRWEVLQTDSIETEEDLNAAAHKWVETLDSIGEELGFLAIPSQQHKLQFDRKTLALIKRARRSRLKLNDLKEQADFRLKRKLQSTVERDQHRAKLAIKKFAKTAKLKHSKRINSLLLDGEAADFHKNVQKAQGKARGKEDNLPCFNNEGILVTEPQDILLARAAYSEALAADPTGISQSSEAWKQVLPDNSFKGPLRIRRPGPSNTDEDPDECNLSADAFLMAIRNIKRNAAPGKSGVLAMHLKKFLEIECQLQTTKDWKNGPKNTFGSNSYPKPLDYSTVALDRWSLPKSLMCPPLVHLLNIMRGCIALKTQPALWNEEVLITLPKPGLDPRDLKNTRGITLSCTEAQAGFRKGQEAISHVVALSEILKRRSNIGSKTLGLYIDFKKAFDRVPHEGLWARLRQIGVHSDLIDIIKRGYDSSTIQCRLGNHLSQPFTRKIGTRQGCPLSPLLFIIYVNDILDAVTKGIEVPGLEHPTQGLLFADDTLIFANTEDEVQVICDRLELYCHKWHFALGHAKCGVVTYGNGSPSTDRQYKVTDGLIPSLNTYKYLGCWITNKSGPVPYQAEKEHSIALSKKIERCYFSSLPLLHDKGIHLLSKARIIQTYLMSAGSYGGEWVGMGQKRTRNMQVMLDRAGRVAYGLKEHNKSLNSLLMCLELGVTPMSIHCTMQRLRLWHKGGHLKTVLHDLISHPVRGVGDKSWTANTCRNSTHLGRGADLLDRMAFEDCSVNHRKAWVSDRLALDKYLHPDCLSPVGDNERIIPDQIVLAERLYQIKLYLWHKEVERETLRCKSVVRYDRFSFGKTSNFVSTSIHVDSVNQGVTYLSLLRMNALPTVEGRIRAIKHGLKRINHTLRIGVCPCCGSPFEQDTEEWGHLLLVCSEFKPIRDLTIGATVRALEDYIGDTMLCSKEHIYVLLLGGLLRDLQPMSSLRYEGKNPFMETTYGSKRLSNWINGYGHIPHVYPKGFAEHGYVSTAAFLQQVVPIFKGVLFADAPEELQSPAVSPGVIGALDTSPARVSVSENLVVGEDLTRARPNGMPDSYIFDVG
ncbi:hypothetical protein VP01_1594g1 [Puccinia sorghi]|uniref:Reverse transcriptase domain-containing protein n=1 Tax=Puccinia sorghi TaxID=27349 RepID=A0A0L6VHM1_9BASI|nr:hypothetical protein VP01_1594g1 [Puccinia sorghi]